MPVGFSAALLLVLDVPALAGKATKVPTFVDFKVPPAPLAQAVDFA